MYVGSPRSKRVLILFTIQTQTSFKVTKVLLILLYIRTTLDTTTVSDQLYQQRLQNLTKSTPKK